MKVVWHKLMLNDLDMATGLFQSDFGNLFKECDNHPSQIRWFNMSLLCAISDHISQYLLSVYCSYSYQVKRNRGVVMVFLSPLCVMLDWRVIDFLHAVTWSRKRINFLSSSHSIDFLVRQIWRKGTTNCWGVQIIEEEKRLKVNTMRFCFYMCIG